MTEEISIRTEGRAGRITLSRPQALNALTPGMVHAIDAALAAWAGDGDIDLVVIDGAGDRAFCAGGDIAGVYRSGRRGDFASGARFWADEYRLNARIAGFPKPYVALMHGFVMGGGVGVSAHGSHRIVCETTQLAMPECMIGLVPDVGATDLLARAPGRLGEFAGLSGHRMGPGDAIRAGFADSFVPASRWPELLAALAAGGNPAIVADFTEPPPEAALAGLQEAIDDAFEATDLAALSARLETSDWGHALLRNLKRQCPLSMACTLDLIRAARRDPGVGKALAREYRFTSRAASDGELLEGIRAAVIDKDRNPVWRDDMDSLRPEEVAAMLAPLGTAELALMMMQVGFIGLGNMGAPMARNLAADGHAVTGFDTAGVSVEGVAPAASAADAARGRDAVITMLPDGAVLGAVYAEIVLAGASGAAFVDCSTVDVDSARAAAALAASAGLLAVDAPVSGGTAGAAAGTLTFMAGGPRPAFDKALPLFRALPDQSAS